MWCRLTSFYMQIKRKIKSLVGFSKEKFSFASTVSFFNNTETDNVTDKLHIGPEQQYSL